MQPTVLHVGPYESGGGMQATIRHHLRNPPPGWTTEVVGTHVDGSAFAKWRAWRRGRRKFLARLSSDPPDLVHVHSAARWSWWRKQKLVRMLVKRDIPVVLQLHSGGFDAFISGSRKAARQFKRICSVPNVTIVSLTEKQRDSIGLPTDTPVIGSPAPPLDAVDPSQRERGKLLLLARPNPMKGHRIAISAILRMRSAGRDVNLHLSLPKQHPWVKGLDPEDGIHAHGWMDEVEVRKLQRTAGLLLIPSEYEGMPIVAMEALSCGLPVLASESCSGILGPGGRILPSLQAQAWADSISELLDDDEAWTGMALAGPSVVADQTPEVIGSRWSALYAAICSQKAN